MQSETTGAVTGITPASLGLSLAEGKTIVAAIQTAMVTAPVQRHRESLRRCQH